MDFSFLKPTPDQLTIFLRGLVVLILSLILVKFAAQKNWLKLSERALLPFLKILLFLTLASLLLTVIGRHQHFLTFSYDLGIYDQAVWKLSRFQAPESTVRDLRNLFGDHFEFTLILFAPLYWLINSSLALLIVQIVAIAASGFFIKQFVAQKFHSETAGYLLFLSWLLSWQVSAALIFDFHPLVIGACFLLIGLLLLESKRLKLGTVFLILAALSRETIAIYLFFIALVLLFSKGRRKLAFFLALLSPLYFFLAVKFLAPYFLGRPYLYFQIYSQVPESSLAEKVLSIFTPQKILLWFYLWFPAIASSVYPSAWLAMLPAWGERLLSTQSQHALPLHQYNMLPLAVTFWVLLRNLNKKNLAAFSLLTFLLSISSGIILHRDNYALVNWIVNPPLRLSQHEQEIYSLISMVPKNASVATNGVLVPHLSARDKIYDLAVYRGALDDIDKIKEVAPEYILLDTSPRLTIAPFSAQRATRFRETLKQSSLYESAQEKGTVTLFKKSVDFNP